MKRVVADTNVLVSAIQFGGKPKQRLDLAVDGHIDLSISEAILEETIRVLRDKFHRTPEELDEIERQLRVVARTVKPIQTIKAIDADPADDRILECAVGADAELIISGDKHLLALRSFRTIRIQRIERISRESRPGPSTREMSTGPPRPAQSQRSPSLSYSLGAPLPLRAALFAASASAPRTLAASSNSSVKVPGSTADGKPVRR